MSPDMQCYASQTMATVMTWLARAFATFGGEPSELLFDPMKAVDTRDGRETGGTLVLNDEFQLFAAAPGVPAARAPPQTSPPRSVSTAAPTPSRPPCSSYSTMGDACYSNW